MSIRVLERSTNSLIYELPAGKPTPYKECRMGQDDRDRVNQKAQTISACQYYALNYLRHRIGKYPSEDLKPAREIEKICSSRRKTISAVDGLMAKILEDACSIKAPTPEEKKQILQFIKEHAHWKTDTIEDLTKLMREEKFEKRFEINTKFFKDLKVDVKGIFASEITLENGYTDNWSNFKQLGIKQKATVLDNFAFKVMAEKYGLKKSTWRPSDKIESLISELGKNGPLTISGICGKVAYLDEPFCLKQQIGNRDIYAWKPGAKRKPASAFLAAHTCLIVGAKKVDAKEYVYFIDPQDPSDPKDKSLQKIYLSSYKNFMSHTIDLHGRAHSQELVSEVVAQAPAWSKAGYAYYGYNLLH